jgi:hypothetical protein
MSCFHFGGPVHTEHFYTREYEHLKLLIVAITLLTAEEAHEAGARHNLREIIVFRFRSVSRSTAQVRSFLLPNYEK